jgi:hypothetical protein
MHGLFVKKHTPITYRMDSLIGEETHGESLASIRASARKSDVPDGVIKKILKRRCTISRLAENKHFRTEIAVFTRL